MQTDPFELTRRFNEQVCGIAKPASPTRLGPERKSWTGIALREEVQEFIDADTIQDEVDALIDLIYFAAGRMQEMGVNGARAFNEVHACNMRKVRGDMAKRPGAMGFDAIKPPGWVAPDYAWLFDLAGSTLQVGMEVSNIHNSRIGTVVDLRSNGIAVVDTGRRDYDVSPASDWLYSFIGSPTSTRVFNSRATHQYSGKFRVDDYVCIEGFGQGQIMDFSSDGIFHVIDRISNRLHSCRADDMNFIGVGT